MNSFDNELQFLEDHIDLIEEGNWPAFWNEAEGAEYSATISCENLWTILEDPEINIDYKPTEAQIKTACQKLDPSGGKYTSWLVSLYKQGLISDGLTKFSSLDGDRVQCAPDDNFGTRTLKEYMAALHYHMSVEPDINKYTSVIELTVDIDENCDEPVFNLILSKRLKTLFNGALPSEISKLITNIITRLDKAAFDNCEFFDIDPNDCVYGSKLYFYIRSIVKRQIQGLKINALPNQIDESDIIMTILRALDYWSNNNFWDDFINLKL